MNTTQAWQVVGNDGTVFGTFSDQDHAIAIARDIEGYGDDVICDVIPVQVSDDQIGDII